MAELACLQKQRAGSPRQKSDDRFLVRKNGVRSKHLLEKTETLKYGKLKAGRWDVVEKLNGANGMSDMAGEAAR